MNEIKVEKDQEFDPYFKIKVENEEILTGDMIFVKEEFDGKNHSIPENTGKEKTTIEQFHEMVTYMEHYASFAREIKKGSKCKETHRYQWERLTKGLNALGPPIRTWEGWRKVFSDFKSDVRRKIRNHRKDRRGNVVVPQKPLVLNDLQQRLNDLLFLEEALEEEEGPYGASSPSSCSLSSDVNPIPGPSRQMSFAGNLDQYSPHIYSAMSSDSPQLFSQTIPGSNCFDQNNFSYPGSQETGFEVQNSPIVEPQPISNKKRTKRLRIDSSETGNDLVSRNPVRRQQRQAAWSTSKNSRISSAAQRRREARTTFTRNRSTSSKILAVLQDLLKSNEEARKEDHAWKQEMLKVSREENEIQREILEIKRRRLQMEEVKFIENC
ncbi:hypothetical protein DMENIID0001_084630 [Sergentomyia squamirostris]